MRSAIVLLLLLATPTGVAAQGLIGVYSDLNATQCTLADSMPRPHQIEIIAENTAINAIEFQAVQVGEGRLPVFRSFFQSPAGP